MRPLLLRPALVRATLEGRKTQTRRVVTDRTSRGNVPASRLDLSRAWVDPGPSPAGNAGPYLKAPVLGMEAEQTVERLYPWIVPGDRLWVRETWAQTYVRTEKQPGVVYLADGPDFLRPTDSGYQQWGANMKGVWRPSIHMPRWACRLVLEVTAVRVERLQSITAADAHAEGLAVVEGERPEQTLARFAEGWDAINGARGFGWDANPWVWVIEYRTCRSGPYAASPLES